RFGGRFSFVVLAACVSMAIVPLLLVGRLIGVRDDGAAREAATYVDYATTSADAVLVWGSRAEVLVLADRRSATRLVYQYAALALDATERDAALRRKEARSDPDEAVIDHVHDSQRSLRQRHVGDSRADAAVVEVDEELREPRLGHFEHRIVLLEFREVIEEQI